MTPVEKRACIAGIGETRYTRRGGQADRSEFELACEAILAAAADAGIAPSDIDGITSFSNDPSEAIQLQVALGIPELRLSAMLWGGGGGGSCGAIELAALAVEAGHADNVVAFRSICQGRGVRFGRYNAQSRMGGLLHPFGLFGPPQALALPIRRHMHEYGTTTEHLREIALTCYANAQLNPRAVMYGRPLDAQTYDSARMVSELLRLYDCCQESDGACAVLVTSRERARDMRQPTVRVLSAAHGSGPGWWTGALTSHNQPLGDYASVNGRTVARNLFDRAGVRPADVDVAQFYDNFTGLVLMALEDFGFCGRGEGGPFVATGAIRADGALPINTHGGNLAEAYLHGLSHVVEGVRQIRGQSTLQIAGAELCFVSGGPGPAPTSALLLSPA